MKNKCWDGELYFSKASKPILLGKDALQQMGLGKLDVHVPLNNRLTWNLSTKTN